MHVDVLRRITDADRTKRPEKNEEPTVGFFPSRKCSSTPVAFGRGFLRKEQRDNTGASPILS